jgi:hypothetical protein
MIRRAETTEDFAFCAEVFHAVQPEENEKLGYATRNVGISVRGDLPLP